MSLGHTKQPFTSVLSRRKCITHEEESKMMKKTLSRQFRREGHQKRQIIKHILHILKKSTSVKQ